MPLSALPPVVAATLEQSYGHHRTRWFESILDRIGTWAAAVAGGGTPLILTATGQGAREAVVANCVAPGDPVWLETGGAFARAVSIARADAMPLDHVPTAGREAPLVLVEHVTASGVVADLDAWAGAMRRSRPDAVLVVDASVSLGADVASFEPGLLDAVILVPEGALMGIPGLSIIVAGDRLLERVRASRTRLPQRPFYFDLLKYAKTWGKRTTPYSPNISAAVALAKSLELIEANGGLGAHVERHAARAKSLRAALAGAAVTPAAAAGRLTNAFTVLDVHDDADPEARAATLVEAGVPATPHGLHGLRIDHAGYLPPGVLERACDRLRSGSGSLAPETSDPEARPGGEARIVDFTFGVEVPINIPADRPWPIFEIPASDFVAQARTHAIRERGGAAFERHIEGAAIATFRSPHRPDPRTLASRTVGFIGAGNIVRHAVEKCRAIGVTSLMVYSPSLASGQQARQPGDPADRRAPAWWESRGVAVARRPDEIWTTAHTIVLLPWFYDAEALGVFGRSREYLNDALVDGQVLDLIEREGRADLIVNAAARQRLVDRAALARALAAGWLRYYSDELPSPDDPLLAFANVRFTGHVGGSCAGPQAAVARNTHHILRHVIAQLRSGASPSAADSGNYRVNVVNAGMSGAGAWRSLGGRVAADDPIRILITDKFDLDSLDLDALRHSGERLEVTDVSHEKPTPAGVASHLRRLRPHVLMVRSRTPIDATVAEAATEVTELAAVVRPGVGVDNVYGGLQALTALGVQVINEPFGNSAAVAEMTLHFIASAADPVLLAPGPTRIEPDVFAVTAEYAPPAATRYGRAQAAVERGLHEWLHPSGAIVVLSGSGTGLMEAGVVNLTGRGDHGIVISHGKFGDRFAEIAEAAGRVAQTLRVDEPDWGRAISPEAFSAVLEERSRASQPPLGFVCFQQNETSSGIAYRTAQIQSIVRAARAHNPGVMVIVDAISGAFAHPIDAAALDVDLVIVGSHKGLGVSSGIAYGALSKRALAKMLQLGGFDGDVEHWLAAPSADVVTRFESTQGVGYLSLLRLLRDQRLGTWSDTPSVFHVLSTERALERHQHDGGQAAVLDRHARLGDYVRDALASAGLRPVADPSYASDSVTPAFLPEGLEAGDLRRRLESEYGIAIAGAQGDYWKQRMVRIGHLGFVYQHDVARCLRGIRAIVRPAVTETEAPTPVAS